MTRTTCACSICKAACTAMPGYLVPADLPFFSPDQLMASDGAKVIKDGKLLSLPTLTPRQKSDGSCIFFESGKCTVHDHSPYGCRMTNACDTTGGPAVERVSQQGLYEIYVDMQEDGPYSQLRHHVPQAPPLAYRRQKYDFAIREAERKLLRKKIGRR